MGGDYSRAQLEQIVSAAAAQYGIRQDIAFAQVAQESSWQPDAESAYAAGLFQFTPGTAARFGLSNADRYDPAKEAQAWGKYMRWLLDRYNGDYSLALAGYNAGEGNVDKYNGIPPFTETQNYVRKILAAAGSGGGSAITVPGAVSSGLSVSTAILLLLGLFLISD